MSHARVQPDKVDCPDSIGQGPTRQDLESWIESLIHLHTARARYYDGSPISREMRELWRQAAQVHVRELLREKLSGMVKAAVRRAWRKDVVPEFRPWELAFESRVRRVGPERYDLSEAADNRGDEASVANEVLAAIEWALDRMSWRQRARVEVFLYGDQTISQVAEKFRISTRTVYRDLKAFKEGFERARMRDRG
jgi:DNA-directed RNA polymerase specialized sigma24 family protein